MAKEGVKRSYSKPMTEDEFHKLARTGGVLTVSALLFMGGILALINYDILSLSPKGMQPESLKGFASKAEYALRYQTLLVFWLVFNVMVTIYGRYTTRAFNPLNETTEEGVQIFKNILTNSFETIIISVVSQLAFVSYAQPVTIMKYIPMINIIQFIGRVAFFAGYPLYRAFGFQLSLMPNLFLVLFNSYNLFGFVFKGLVTGQKNVEL